jgi:hypothetical protein
VWRSKYAESGEEEWTVVSGRAETQGSALSPDPYLRGHVDVHMFGPCLNVHGISEAAPRWDEDDDRRGSAKAVAEHTVVARLRRDTE